MWNADEYLKFSSDRARPFADLLAQVSMDPIESIVDLGCGTGHLTRGMAERWPKALVIGVDRSTEMLAKAEPLAIPGRLEFVQAEIADWTARQPVDLIVSNAALHWVDDHESLLNRLSRMLSPSGTLAVQMPNRFQGPVQEAIDAVVADPRWATQLKGVGLHRESVRPILWYVRLLHHLGLAANAWETTYVHVLSGEKPVLEWIKGTGLRPLLAALDEAKSTQFLTELGLRLQSIYPPTGNVTLFPMPRLFFVAQRLFVPRRQ
jgi:trans-aconitate 2-methyltransferase